MKRKEKSTGEAISRPHLIKQKDSRNKLPLIRKDKSDMRSFNNLFHHGLYFSLYSFVKNLSFPSSNLLGYMVMLIFTHSIHAKYISEGVTIFSRWNVHIGKKSSLNSGVIFNNYGQIWVGEEARITAYP